MSDLPVILKVEGRRCVVIGGGKVALRRATALHKAGAFVCVVAPQTDPEIGEFADEIRTKRYGPQDLEGAFLVVLATDSPEVNAEAAHDAVTRGILVNRTDRPDMGDITIPAHEHHGPVTIAVHTDGVSASAAGKIRRELSAAMDPDWPVLLRVVAPYRKRIQASLRSLPDRQDRLKKLTDEQAMRVLRDRGPEALRVHCENLVESP